MSFFRGENRVLFVKINDDYIPIGCLTDNSFSETVEMLETTTWQDNGWKTDRPTTQSFSVDFSGLQVISTDDIKSYDELVTFKRNRQLLDWKIAGNSLLDAEIFKGHIEDLTEPASNGEFLTFEGTISGFGEPVRESSLISSNFTMDNDNITMDNDNITMDYDE